MESGYGSRVTFSLRPYRRPVLMYWDPTRPHHHRPLHVDKTRHVPRPVSTHSKPCSVHPSHAHHPCPDEDTKCQYPTTIPNVPDTDKDPVSPFLVSHAQQRGCGSDHQDFHGITFWYPSSELCTRWPSSNTHDDRHRRDTSRWVSRYNPSLDSLIPICRLTLALTETTRPSRHLFPPFFTTIHRLRFTLTNSTRSSRHPFSGSSTPLVWHIHPWPFRRRVSWGVPRFRHTCLVVLNG